jgi:hypothetical protein
VSVRPVATAAALVGGIAWVANYFVDNDVLVWAGAVLLAVAVAAAGASLVRHPGIKVIAAVGALLLVGSVFSLVRESADDAVVHLVAGGLATLLVAVTYARRPHHGNH